MTPEIFRTHLAYKEWQARLLIQAVKPLTVGDFDAVRGASHGSIKGTLQHMYGADFIWLRRVQKIPVTRADVKMPETVTELEERWLALIGEWKSWAETIPDTSWNDKLEYTMFDGSHRSNPLWQVVLHVVNHGTLHGGQVVTMLRQAGVTPPQTDILFFYRELNAVAVA